MVLKGNNARPKEAEATMPTTIKDLLVAAMCCVKVDGEAILNYKEVASKGIQWDVIFLVSVVMPLSTALTAEETGITPFQNNTAF